jgi:ribosomal protein uL22
MAIAYAYQPKRSLDGAEKRTARARLRGVNASYKDLSEVCRAVRYKPTEEAIEFLKRASEGKQAIPMPRFGKRRGHVRQLGGKKGGWPIKSAKIVLGVIESALANASKQGLGETKIAHIAANKEQIYPRLSPKGRRIMHNLETAFVEVVLEEWQKESKKVKKEAKKEGKDKGA